MEILHYIQNNWFQLSIDLIAALNVIAAGSRTMGWNKLSDELGIIEDAITDMIQTGVSSYKSKKKEQTKEATK